MAIAATRPPADTRPPRFRFRRGRPFAGGPLRKVHPIGALGSACIRPAMARHPEAGGIRADCAAGPGRRPAKSRGSVHGNGFGSLPAADGGAGCVPIPSVAGMSPTPGRKALRPTDSGIASERSWRKSPQDGDLGRVTRRRWPLPAPPPPAQLIFCRKTTEPASRGKEAPRITGRPVRAATHRRSGPALRLPAPPVCQAPPRFAEMPTPSPALSPRAPPLSGHSHR